MFDMNFNIIIIKINKYTIHNEIINLFNLS